MKNISISISFALILGLSGFWLAAQTPQPGPGVGGATLGANVFSGNQTIPLDGAFLFAGRSQIQSPADGKILLWNSGFTGFTILQFGGTSASWPGLASTTGANPLLSVQAANGTGVADFAVPNQKSTTGQRFVCIDTAGKLVSSASACSGT
jgi:hypothetical protein